MLRWLPTLLILAMLLFFEVITYALYLLIKSLKIYIRKNSEPVVTADGREVRSDSRKTIRRFIVGNAFLCLLIIGISIYLRNVELYNTENVLYLQSKGDVEEIRELLEDNNLDYKILNHGKRVKMKNESDLTQATHLLENSGIGFSVIEMY
jgi:hypothetical protein